MLPPPRSLSVLLVLLAAPVLGCSTHYIPNTDVEDSEQNRKLVAFCEQYRHAVERKNIGMLLKLASPKYYEDGGNVDASDDIDYEGLEAYLHAKFQDAKAIRYEIRYRRVIEEENVFYVDYTFSASYRIPTSKGELWQRKVDDNRLEIVPYNDEFRILTGM